MTLTEWLRHRWQSVAIPSTYLEIDRSHVELKKDQVLDATPVEAGYRYFRLWLAQMSLKNDREWATRWYPAVLSAVNFDYGGKPEEISHIAGETSLKNLDLANLNSGVTVNYPLTGLMPFNGGTVELETALMSVEGKSDMKSLLKVLGTFSSVLAVPQLSAALSIAGPLADGIAEFVGASGARPELRLHDVWTGVNSGGSNLLHAGYFVVLAAPPNTIRANELWVKQDQLYRGASLEKCDPLTGFHFMLLRIDTTATLDNWEFIASIADPFNQAMDFLKSAVEADGDVRTSMLAQAEKRYASARAATFRARELTKVVGGNQLRDGLEKQWNKAKAELGAGAFGDGDLPTLNSAMRLAMSPAEAAALGQQTEDELWLLD
jgi:hypothetical protein